MGSIKILYFAAAREARGAKQEQIDLSVLQDNKPQALLQHLRTNFEDLSGILDSAALAINEEYVEVDNPSITLKPGDTVAIIPPISGG
mmetsp:Transcript_14022/g.15967  ORF Transcript_14022/g.15967 Transcript_14022/m.15967 type:complete len:88 (+) Transcript_14022:670-933(+)|eukprot:CAMPEP_0184041534 /NCGR_PEP_ID=MMETSP0955-20130417/62953_1 /TAXON_ID=627963 /ORGANISM="Aplanochytrium sp, Strain PBS07" /LENGTH=87 /DNA_ID=CAMNT_0026331901 /DNA_START=653 /DNA_END=916 /DNA_ORIENTATION=+